VKAKSIFRETRLVGFSNFISKFPMFLLHEVSLVQVCFANTCVSLSDALPTLWLLLELARVTAPSMSFSYFSISSQVTLLASIFIFNTYSGFISDGETCKGKGDSSIALLRIELAAINIFPAAKIPWDSEVMVFKFSISFSLSSTLAKAPSSYLSIARVNT
jgi:hypothetical protein